VQHTVKPTEQIEKALNRSSHEHKIDTVASDGHKLFISSLTLAKFPIKR